MPDASPLQALLSLFTAADRAESIAGDLTEEREIRGSAWFWFHGLRTTFALFTNTLACAPVMALSLVVLGFVLFAALAFSGVAAVSLFPLMGSGSSWVLLSLFWWGAALGTGAYLVRVSPKFGMTACLTLAVAGEAMLLSCPLFFAFSARSLVYASAMFAPAPLLAGGAIVRRRTVK